MYWLYASALEGRQSGTIKENYNYRLNGSFYEFLGGCACCFYDLTRCNVLEYIFEIRLGVIKKLIRFFMELLEFFSICI